MIARKCNPDIVSSWWNLEKRVYQISSSLLTISTVGVFGINCFCLIYLLFRSGLVTDFTEPQNLFALAVNSRAHTFQPSLRILLALPFVPYTHSPQIFYSLHLTKNVSF